MEKYRRKKYLTEKKYQLRYTAVIMIAMLIIAVVIGGIAYWQIKIMDPTPDQLAKFPGAETYLIRIALVFAAAFFAGIFLSHKIIGPVKRIEESLRKINSGNFNINVRLRSGDEMNEIAGQLDILAEKLKSLSEKYPEIKNKFNN